jgi:uncharacterized protein YecE (DUF72 family)
MARTGVIRAGMGGFTFEPWRGVFYPAGLRQAEELAYATRHVTSIEINGTYYSSQKPETFAKWAATAPEGFVFSLKASRFCTNRKVLAQGGESIAKFLGQGLVELGDKLGPILWQFMATKVFDPADFEAFLDLLPQTYEGLAMRHCVEVRHESFFDPRFVEMCRARKVAISLSQNAGAPFIPDLTADFAYARLMAGSDEIETCYAPAELDLWAGRFADYARGQVPADLTPVAPAAAAEGPRDVFVYFIREGKVRAPAGAMALLERTAQAD